MSSDKETDEGLFTEVFGPSRFNRSQTFPVLYLAQDDQARRLALRKLSREDEWSFSSRVLAALEVRLSKVLDLCDRRIRQRLGLTLRDFESTEDWSVTQAIGIAARRAGLEGILYPVGARPLRRNLAVLLEAVTPTELIPTALHWPREGSGTVQASP